MDINLQIFLTSIGVVLFNVGGIILTLKFIINTPHRFREAFGWIMLFCLLEALAVTLIRFAH